MEKTNRQSRKLYRRPLLHRYGDLRKLTGGGGQKKDESGTLNTQKTRTVGGG